MNSKKVVGAVLGVVAFAVAYAVAFNAAKGRFGGKSVERELETMAAELSKRLPMQVDPVTRWDRVEVGPGKSYAYIYTLSQDLTPAEKTALQQRVTSQALASQEMKPIFQAGVTVWYRYYDKAGNKVQEFSVQR